MTERIDKFIELLREELKQYGEMLALLDQEQGFVVAHIADEVLNTVSAINMQAAVVQEARQKRQKCQAELAGGLGIPATASFVQLLSLLPPDYRPLLQALVQENNELLSRIHKRTRQNHVLLSRSVDLMQRSMTALFPAFRPAICNASNALLNPIP
jgi:hypothetical protein